MSSILLSLCLQLFQIELKKKMKFHKNPMSGRLVFSSNATCGPTFYFRWIEWKCFCPFYIRLPAACRFTLTEASFSHSCASAEPPLWRLIRSLEVWDRATCSSANFFPTQTCSVCHSRAKHLICAKLGLKIMALQLLELWNYWTETGCTNKPSMHFMFVLRSSDCLLS